MSSIVCMEQKYEKVQKMQIFSEFFYEGGENPCGLPDGVPAKKEFPPAEGTRTGRSAGGKRREGGAGRYLMIRSSWSIVRRSSASVTV